MGIGINSNGLSNYYGTSIEEMSKGRVNPDSVAEIFNTNPINASNKTTEVPKEKVTEKPEAPKDKTLGEYWQDFKNYLAAKTPSSGKTQDKNTPLPVQDILNKRGNEQHVANASPLKPAGEAAKQNTEAKAQPKVALGQNKTLGDLVAQNREQLSAKYGTKNLWGKGGLVDLVAKENGYSGFDDKNLNKIDANSKFNLSGANSSENTKIADKGQPAVKTKQAPSSSSERKASQSENSKPGYKVYSEDGRELKPGTAEFKARDKQISNELSTPKPGYKVYSEDGRELKPGTAEYVARDKQISNELSTPKPGYKVYSEDGRELKPGTAEFKARDNQISNELSN